MCPCLSVPCARISGPAGYPVGYTFCQIYGIFYKNTCIPERGVLVRLLRAPVDQLKEELRVPYPTKIFIYTFWKKKHNPVLHLQGQSDEKLSWEMNNKYICYDKKV